MSNLFQRLAAQQLDPGTVRVRPMASLPFQRVPEFTEEASGLGSEDRPAKAPDTESTSSGAHSALALASAPDKHHSASAQSQEPPLLTPRPLSAERHRPAPTASLSQNAQASRAGVSNRPASDIMPQAAHSAPPLPSPVLMDIATASHESPVSNEASVRVASPVERPVHGFTEASADTAIDGFPASLLPRQGTVGSMSSERSVSPPLQRNSDATHGDSSEPNEVHVHIGRIEVTAIREPVQAGSRQKPRQAPMSLDDYLARRQRGAT